MRIHCVVMWLQWPSLRRFAVLIAIIHTASMIEVSSVYIIGQLMRRCLGPGIIMPSPQLLSQKLLQGRMHFEGGMM